MPPTGPLLPATSQIISDFFGKLGSLYGRLNLLSKPMLIYNADETGISVVHKPGKVVTELGRRHVYSVVSGERGKNHTIMTCVSASGNVLPPMMIFPRKRAIPDSFKVGAVPNTLFLNSTNGWINSELYLEWLKFFRNNIPPTRPVLLIQDGHTSHMSIEAIEYCKSNEIYILCLPSHTTHILQPLDIGVFKSFKSNFSKACTNYMSKNPGRVITPEFLASLVVEAWYVSLTHLNIMSGFRKSGLFPFNPSMVNDRCTAPSKVFEKTDTDVPLPSQVTPPSSSNNNSSSLLPDDVAPISSVNVSPVATSSQTDALVHVSDNAVNDSSNDKELFTEEQEKLFNKRFEEGYDLYDPLFVTWLKIRHPHRCVSVSSDTFSEGTTTTCSTSVTSSTISTVSSSTRSQSDTLSEILVLPTAVRSSTRKKKVESLNRQAVCLTDLLDDLKLKEEKKRVLEEKQLNTELKRKEREEKRNQKEEEKRKKEEDKKKKEEEKKKKEEEKEELKRKKEEEKKKREEEKKKREEDKKKREEEKRRKEEEKRLKEQSKKKRTKQLQEKTESDSCPICGVMYDDVSGLWIQCDVCDEWIDFELSDKDKLPEIYVSKLWT